MRDVYVAHAVTAQPALPCAGSVGLRQRYRMTGGTGSYLFMAPEVFRHQPYNAKADVYSLGMTMYEMMAGRRPFGDMDPCLAAMLAATDDMRPEWPAQPPQTYTDGELALWPEARMLVERCWAAAAAARCASAWLLAGPDARPVQGAGMSAWQGELLESLQLGEWPPQLVPVCRSSLK